MRPRTLVAAAFAFALSLTPLAAYYHYTHFTSLGAAVEKFDLGALPDRTVTFYVSDASLTGQVEMQYGLNDSFPAAMSQIREAAAVWNGVESSSLRVSFGGLIAQGTPQSTPGGLVVFDDIPPGLVAFSTRTTGDVVMGPDNVPFVPIQQGLVHLNRDLAGAAGPSYVEAFFTTVVHEMGHALGLQHTFTSSTMSTSITRSTSRATPSKPTTSRAFRCSTWARVSRTAPSAPSAAASPAAASP